MNKEYTVDMSKDGLEWEEYQVGGDLEALVHISQSFYDLGWFVQIWDQDDRLVWRDGRHTYTFSTFEQEWARFYGGRLSPHYSFGLPSPDLELCDGC